MLTRCTHRLFMPSWRWLVWLALIVLLHLFAIDWAWRHLGTPYTHNAPPSTLAVTLRPLPSASAPVTLPKVPPPSATTPHPRKLTSVSAPVAPSPDSQDAFDSSVAPAPATPEQPTLTPSSGTSPETNKLQRDLPTYEVAPAPSVEIRYTAQRTNVLQQQTGTAHLRWQYDGSHYTLALDIALPDQPPHHQRSEGVIDRYGVSPLLFIHKPDQQPESSTSFHREYDTIRFSGSDQSPPRLGGEQDPLSVAWQLASIGRKTPLFFEPDKLFPLFVAGSKEADVWLIRVLALEEIDTSLGKIKTWHLSHSAPSGSQSPSVDIWLAPDRDWVPVRWRTTKPNGDVMELVATEITPTPGF